MTDFIADESLASIIFFVKLILTEDIVDSVYPNKDSHSPTNNNFGCKILIFAR